MTMLWRPKQGSFCRILHYMIKLHTRIEMDLVSIFGYTPFQSDFQFASLQTTNFRLEFFYIFNNLIFYCVHDKDFTWGVGTKRDDICLIASVTKSLWLKLRRAFIILTNAASAWLFRSSSRCTGTSDKESPGFADVELDPSDIKGTFNLRYFEENSVLKENSSSSVINYVYQEQYEKC